MGEGDHDCCEPGMDCTTRGGSAASPPYFFRSLGACLAACRSYGRGAADTFDDTLECRILLLNIGEQGAHCYFGATAEEQGNKAFACPHVGKTAPAGVTPLCDSSFPRSGQAAHCARYCEWYAIACHGRPPPFAAAATATAASACQNGCMALRFDGVPGHMHGATVQCRLKAVAVAARSTVPDIHCSHDLICTDEPEVPLDVDGTRLESGGGSGGLRAATEQYSYSSDSYDGVGPRVLARELANVKRRQSKLDELR